jgi:hypothetical protein
LAPGHSYGRALCFSLILWSLTAQRLMAANFGGMGTNFWLAFLPNGVQPASLSLYITSSLGARGTVQSPGLGFTIPFVVGPNGSIQIPITSTAQLALHTTGLVQNNGIEVTSDNPVAVYGMNNIAETSDGFTAIPDVDEGTSYYALGYWGAAVSWFIGPSLLGVVVLQNGTNITLTLPGTAPVTLPGLNQGQTYVVSSDWQDVSGASIQANKPIGVYAGGHCYIPQDVQSANLVVEQMPPTNLWGSNYLTAPLATRSNGDTFRILAAQNNTAVTINGANVATLNQGAFVELTLTGASQILATGPVLVAQYANGENYDGDLNSDPSETLIQPVSQYSNEYVLAPDTVDFTPNFVNLVVPTAAVNGATINGVPVPATSFAPIGASGYEAAAVTVTCTTCLVQAPLPFGAIVYGWAIANAYSYPGGIALSALDGTPTATITPTPTMSGSATPTGTRSPTPSSTPNATQTFTISPTLTPTPGSLLLHLYASSPNPFSSQGTYITYWLQVDALINIRVYDVSGELVRDLNPFAGKAGDNETFWDGKNSSGRPVASGIFIYKVSATTPRDEHASNFGKCAAVR